jgi:hypothetical protein
LSSPKDAASTFMTLLQDEPAEVFAMLRITSRYLRRSYPRSRSS